jgi:hypothetical protein
MTQSLLTLRFQLVGKMQPAAGRRGDANSLRRASGWAGIGSSWGAGWGPGVGSVSTGSPLPPDWTSSGAVIRVPADGKPRQHTSSEQSRGYGHSFSILSHGPLLVVRGLHLGNVIASSAFHRYLIGVPPIACFAVIWLRLHARRTVRVTRCAIISAMTLPSFRPGGSTSGGTNLPPPSKPTCGRSRRP